MNLSRLIIGGVCLTLIALAGCAEPVKESGRLSELSDAQQNQRDHAAAAKDKLFLSLLGELTESIREKGVADSIEICKSRAPALAQSVGDEFGLKIGRTSKQLRNDSNQPPSWAQPWIEEESGQEAVFALGDQKLGVVFPIFLKDTCVLCHGSSTTIPADVRKALAAHYPDDQATGYAAGDLRGWFWVEVPAGVSQNQSRD